ncbi:p-benzoquinone reductase [Ruminiclostridium hungatei]|uniref:p-benzoquinone reductase n=1 Tax=Ruminiclostridium hungatei TaxID=48256 RepID=A0A1V4SJX3_RUMHU|nr:NAD(P)H-dependent oxidoreductase [Ruminiclostridium hungatei]OPX44170.1 p-benzoquinone reductase [Ruminiclostridium hungatei]
MYIVGLNGSANQDGNTSFLVGRVLEECSRQGADTILLDIGKIMNEQKNGYCTACSNPCTGICYKGSRLEEAFEIMKKADGIVVGSPVYFGSVSAQLKAMFDKTRRIRANKWLYNKAGVGVSVGTSRFGGQETALKAMHDMMLVNGMIIVGDGYIDDDCGHHGVCAMRPAKDDENAVKRTAISGRRLVEVCRATVGIRNL